MRVTLTLVRNKHRPLGLLKSQNLIAEREQQKETKNSGRPEGSSNKSDGLYDTSELHGFRDEHDGVLYREGLRFFHFF